MIYKHLVLLLLVASLGACSSLNSLTGVDAKEGEQAIDANTIQEQSGQSDSLAPVTAPLSDDELLVQSLISQSDSYQLSKRALAPSAKTKAVMALEAFNNSEFELSEKLIKHLLATELNLNSAVYVLAGDIALANAKQTDAIVHYKRALSLNEYNAKAANRLAMQLREQGQFLRAETFYTQAINAQPSQPESYRNRAVLYDLYLVEKAKALQDYKVYSALLKHRLAVHEKPEYESASSGMDNTLKREVLSEQQLKALKTNIKLVKRWLADVGRQVASLAKDSRNNSAGGG